MPTAPIDQAQAIRQGEELPLAALNQYLAQALGKPDAQLQVLQFPNGYSNLTYLLQLGEMEIVLRRPPFGAENISKGHDMEREFRVLSLLKPIYAKVPTPLLYCEDKSIIGANFYVMERVQGTILRAGQKLQLAPQEARAMEYSCIDNLIALHQIDITQTDLQHLGKPEGYTQRQVESWCKRYSKVATAHIPALDFVMEWLSNNIPQNYPIACLHNDYKFDNLVLNPQNLSEIKAVLDWEMATIGDAYTDLGIMLSYITEPEDAESLQKFNIQWVEGRLKRAEIVDYYEQKIGKKIDDIVFYYAFGLFKLAGIIQQIYYRYHQGFTQDKRFSSLIFMVRDCAAMAEKAIKLGKV